MLRIWQQTRKMTCAFIVLRKISFSKLKKNSGKPIVGPDTRRYVYPFEIDIALGALEFLFVDSEHDDDEQSEIDISTVQYLGF